MIVATVWSSDFANFDSYESLFNVLLNPILINLLVLVCCRGEQGPLSSLDSAAEIIALAVQAIATLEFPFGCHPNLLHSSSGLE